MIQRSHCANLPRRHNMPSLWYNVRIVPTFRYVTICRHYDTTFALCQPSETSQYAVTIYMIQRSHCFNLPICHNMPSLWYNVRIVSTFRYVTICRHYDATFTLFQPSETSQYAVTIYMIQRSHCVNNMPSLWYNVRIVPTFRDVIVCHHFDTTFTLFQPSEMSQYAVTMIQRSHCVNLPRRHSMPSLWYNIHIGSTFRDVTICRHYDTTFALCQPSDTSQYAVTMIQRSHCFNLPRRHNTPSLWYNVHIVSTFRDVTICRHYDTTFALFQPFKTSQYAVILIQRSHCFNISRRHNMEILFSMCLALNVSEQVWLKWTYIGYLYRLLDLSANQSRNMCLVRFGVKLCPVEICGKTLTPYSSHYPPLYKECTPHYDYKTQVM